MGFPRQEYWSGLPRFPPGDLPYPGIKPTSLMSLALAVIFTTRATWDALTKKKQDLPNTRGFPEGSDSKESACSAGDLGSIPGSGRSPGEGNGYPLQYSCLENPHGQRSLAGYSPWDRKEWDMTERLTLSLSNTSLLVITTARSLKPFTHTDQKFSCTSSLAGERC